MRKLLIANRGEIASRIIRTSRSMGISTVAVYSDADGTAPFVDEADEAVRLPGAAASDTYLRIDLILAAAARTGADAIHPGYGFLSENSAFARACHDAGVTFVGPSPEAIDTMGSKLAAKRIADGCGVPVLGTVTVPDDPEVDAGDCARQCDQIGWPVLVKASAGGGGRGMRIVDNASDLASALSSARREATAGFGDGTLFIERYLQHARHVEIQVLADAHGSAVHLFERECSIQRRHQKVIEESPAHGLDSGLRERMGAAALAVATAVDYVGAGTVEFVVGPDNEFFFLEMNTRLQVEHAVTEAVTGFDLVRAQLLVAQGQPLEPAFFDARQTGHAIEVRLYAEDPAADFLPSSGTLDVFVVDPSGRVRVDSAVVEGSLVGGNYDGMIAKVIASAATRAETAALLAEVLEQAHVGGIATNADLLVNVLRDADFLAGAADTGYLEDPSRRALFDPRTTFAAHQVHAGVAALARQHHNRISARTLASVPSGWRNNRTQPQLVRFTSPSTEFEVEYALDPSPVVTVDGVDLDIGAIAQIDGESVLCTVAGVRRRYTARFVNGTWYVHSALGASALVERPLLAAAATEAAAGTVASPMPGVVAMVNVAVGDIVESGQKLLVLESMKMEHTVTAPVSGRVGQLLTPAGTQVEAGTTMALIDVDS